MTRVTGRGGGENPIRNHCRSPHSCVFIFVCLHIWEAVYATKSCARVEKLYAMCGEL